MSDGIRRFLAQKDEEDRKKENERKKIYTELMEKRSDKDKNKIRKMLKVTKSANRSVLDDAVNTTDTALTMDGPEQPDEDDYGYTSHESSALYKNLMDKYKSIPEDKKFAQSSGRSKHTDLKSTKDRVRDAILREREEQALGRKRVRDTNSETSTLSTSEQKPRSRKNLYDPKIEREEEERKRKEEEDQKRRLKFKNRPPPPPSMDFKKLLKLAEEKQHQPIQVEVVQKQKKQEPERLLTGKEKREMELRKAEAEQRERRKLGVADKQNNNVERKPGLMSNGRIPKLNGTNTSATNTTATNTAATKAKPPNVLNKSSEVYAPSRLLAKKSAPISSSSIDKIPKSLPTQPPPKPTSSSSTSKPGVSAKPSAPPHQSADRKMVNLKQKPIDTPKGPSKLQSQLTRKPTDMKSVKPRDFPPKDVIKSREFPPKDVVRSRDFPPKDVVRGREFPPRDMNRSHGKARKKMPSVNKKRILDDSDESEYDSEMDDFIDDDEPELDYSRHIRDIFGYDKSRYRDEDYDSDNMESNFAQQQREEFISKKIGIMEDLEDMRLEEEEKKQKVAKRRRVK